MPALSVQTEKRGQVVEREVPQSLRGSSISTNVLIERPLQYLSFTLTLASLLAAILALVTLAS